MKKSFFGQFAGLKVIKLKFILTIFIILGLILVTSYCFYVIQERKYDLLKKQILTAEDPDIQRRILKSSLKDFGPEKTYRLVFSVFGDSMPLEGHRWAHILGELYYEKYGVKGMSFCELNLSFGCYHGFFTEAIPKEGGKFISRADDFCKSKLGENGYGCQHGIGHGVMEFFGSSKINEALKACSSLSFKGKIFGCQAGVFMDYNMFLGAKKGEVKFRNFNLQRPYEPCDVVSNDYQESCYYAYSQWVFAINNKNITNNVKLCNGIQSEENNYACLLGVGATIALDSAYDSKKSAKRCLSISNQKGRVLCMTGAAGIIYAAMPFGERKANFICRNLKNIIYQNYCLKNFDLHRIYGLQKSRVQALP